MFETIALTLGTVYIGVAGLFALLFGLALIKTNGFQGFADAANRMGGQDKYTDINIQWYMFTIIFGWPILALWLLFLPKRQVS